MKDDRLSMLIKYISIVCGSICLYTGGNLNSLEAFGICAIAISLTPKHD